MRTDVETKGEVMTPGPYSIGSRVWPGVSRVIEESGEVGQLLGKLIGAGGSTTHWGCTNLDQKLTDEVADLRAALQFFIEANELPVDDIDARTAFKLDRYRRWHKQGLAKS